MRAMKVFRDRDYVKTGESFFFCVVDEVHPPGRVTAYLKYAPEKGGGGRYRRALPFYSVPHVEDTLRFLEKNHPRYLFLDPLSGLRFSAVPLEDIACHYCPEERLRSLLAEGAPDDLERKARDLAVLLSRRGGVETQALGLTGSILIGLHNPRYSDIDLIVYGKNSSLKVRDALLTLYGEGDSEVRRFEGERLKAWCLEKTQLHPLTPEEAEFLYQRAWNRGVFRGVMFSVHPVRLDFEVEDAYGRKKTTPEGIVQIEARIQDDGEAIFLPSVYKVREVKVTEGPAVEDLTELVSYEGLYGGVYRKGEQVAARGLLEKVEDLRSGKTYRRVLVGSRAARGADYIKLLPQPRMRGE
ncbi:nucleotidyltransferase domain-containing protein [Candidatus Hecatella orcuttiae]|uniref:nucleotidyltransferase domain-containing protein n=1 Tax=Candidatus Hecatella orcuttiae TaxID=1935119 RepID=UPI0028680F88|nr:nucleotidyltransferase domain-containing protein [Candidatus Hecatella orcuttiae]